MAQLMMEPNKAYIENVREELLRDSLESCADGCDNLIISTIRPNETDSYKTSEEHTGSGVSSQNDLAKDSSTVEKEQKPKTDKKKHVMKPNPKNMIEMNKMKIKKGQAVNSYSKIHQKKVSKTTPTGKNGNNQSETSGPSNAAIELRKQLVLDGILTDKDELSNFDSYEDMPLYNSYNYGVQERNQCDGLDMLIGRDECSLGPARSNETNISQFDKGYFVQDLSMSNNLYTNRHYPNNGYKYVERKSDGAFSSPEDDTIGHEHQLPPVRTFPTSVQSAPADIQGYMDISYKKSFRPNSLHVLKPGECYADLNNSMTSLASTKSMTGQGDSMTYSGLFANSKQNSRTNFKPYTLSDYKRLKKQGKPGGLGPDTKSEEHQQKAKKARRQKEYSVSVKQRNTFGTYHYGKKNRTATTKEISVQKQEVNARRLKALEYSKTIPKPVTSKNQNVWKSPSKAVEKPQAQTLLAILQQRHENEKKTIDAMRKDLQAKLTTR